MEYNLKYITKEYPHGWSIWLERDGKKIMIGSAIKSEKEVYELINNIKLEQIHLNNKVKVSANNREAFCIENKPNDSTSVDINLLLDEYNDYLSLFMLFKDEEYMKKAELVMLQIKNNTK
jgi:hypothetical protein